LSTGRIIGCAGIGMLVLLAVAGPGLVGQDPARQDLMATLLPPGSPGHLLGTDHLGRDLAARLLSGARVSLLLAACAVLSAAIVGVSLGMVAGWNRGWVDRVASGLADAVLAIPGLLLVLLMAAIQPDSWWTLYAGLSLTLWVEFFRVARARTLIIACGPAVEAASLLGLGAWHMVRRHLWPDLAPQVLTLAVFGAATAVTALATLGFLSVGLRPPKADWGVMMAELLPSWREAPWGVLAPVVCLAVTVLLLRLAAGQEKQP
jgi:peptide/nickel transport system permease protein